MYGISSPYKLITTKSKWVNSSVSFMLAYILNPEQGNTNISFSIIQAVGFLLIFLSIKLPVKGWEEKGSRSRGGKQVLSSLWESVFIWAQHGYAGKLYNANSNSSMKIMEKNKCQYNSQLIKNWTQNSMCHKSLYRNIVWENIAEGCTNNVETYRI